MDHHDPPPKGTGDYRVIGMVEVIWKITSIIINNRLRAAIYLHDDLHGLRKGRGVGAATLEANFFQQLEGIYNEPLLQVFLDIKESYNSLEITHLMGFLWRYGLSANLQRIHKRY